VFGILIKYLLITGGMEQYLKENNAQIQIAVHYHQILANLFNYVKLVWIKEKLYQAFFEINEHIRKNRNIHM